MPGVVARHAASLLLVVAAIAAVVTPARAGWFGTMFAGDAPALGSRNGALQPCPDKPNCVLSQATDSAHAIAPFRYDDERGVAMTRLATAMRAEGAKIVMQRDDYLRAEFTSRIMGFVDDVEFALDAQAHRIDVRSASRLGYSDLGVNRARVEKLRARFAVP